MKINIIQFLPYYPPHKGGLETHAQQWAQRWIKQNYGNVYNITFNVGIEEYADKQDQKLFDNQGNIIGYEDDSGKVYILPAFDIIWNFPFPKFWTRQFWYILKLCRQLDAQIIITRTRFFLSSLIGGIFSKLYHKKWVHIEHGSGYVLLKSKIKSQIAYLYDRLIGKLVFKKADLVIPISNACQEFISNCFISRELNVIYRGIEIPSNLNNDQKIRNRFPNKIIIGNVGRLYKWKNIESLIGAYYLLDVNIQQKIQIIIVGDGEDYENLQILDKEKLIYFTGEKSFVEALEIQAQFDIHFHTSSPGGGLASTVLQAMGLGCMIIGTPYEGVNEIITDGVNGILLENDSIEEIKKGLELGVAHISNKEIFALRNKEKIIQEFKWENNIQKYYQLFQRLI